MKFLTALTLVSMMTVAFAADTPKLGEDQKTAHEQLSGTECMAPACVAARERQIQADRDKAAQGKSDTSSAKKK